MSTLSGIASVASVMRVQHQPREVLDRAITAGVQQALRYARDVVPAYAAEGYDVPPLAGLDDVARLPLLRKADVLAAGVTPFHAPGFTRDNVQIYTTSGTTGLILEVWHDAGNYGHDRACNIRRFFATGRYRPWSRLVHFKPFPLDTSWYQRLGIFRREVVYSALPVRTRCERLLAAGPHAIIGYPIMLRDLLRGLTDDELAQLRRTLRVVFTESELLTAPVRNQLADGFGVPVFNEYSAYEALHIGFDCTEGQMHIAEDRIYLEIVDSKGDPVPDGVEGHVVVTGYRERAMPLLRYWLGDRAARRSEPCACGRTLRRLELTTGRADDYVVLSDGERIYAGTFIGMAIGTPGVAECMVRQDATGQIIVYLVPDARVGRSFDELAGAARDWLYGSAGRKFELSFEPADQLELTPGGKGRFVVSQYRPD
jgi:phenylacetate-CoA ligase